MWAVASLALAACSLRAAGPPAPAFELTNQLGETVSREGLQGRVVVLTFLYTHCPDVCPLYLSKIGQAMFLAGEDAARGVAVVAATVDPERDTVEQLRDYMAQFPPGWQFLTGTPGQLKTLWEDYGIFVSQGEAAPGEDSHHDHAGYEVTHTAKVVLIDREGRLRSELMGDWDVAELAEKVGRLAVGEPLPRPGLLASLSKYLYRCGPFVFSSIGDAIMFYTAMLLAPLTGLVAAYFLLLRRHPRG